MIDAETYAEIRKLAIQGESQRSISKQLGISRDTVAKYSKGSHIPGVSEQRSETESAGKAEIKEAIWIVVKRNFFEQGKNPQDKAWLSPCLMGFSLKILIITLYGFWVWLFV